jgi:hypothetical protein
VDLPVSLARTCRAINSSPDVEHSASCHRRDVSADQNWLLTGLGRE